MALSSLPSGENENAFIYKWKNKSKSTTAVNGTETTFEFEAISDVSIVNISGIDTNPTPDKFTESTNGVYTYNTYATSWTTKTGSLQGFDCQVYFRKNGVDSLVDGASASVTSVAAGTTNIEVEFAQAPTTAVADSILLSYAYTDVTNPEPTTFCVKDFNPKYNGRDYSTTKCIGGKVSKRRDSADLTEVSMTILKTSNALSAIMLGEREVSTINSKTVRNTTGNNYVVNYALAIKVTDPDNAKNMLIAIYRNLGATSIDFKGGADADLEESITVKCSPEDSIELEVEA